MSDANHLEQDRVRAQALKPALRSMESSISGSINNSSLVFPTDAVCWPVTSVSVTTSAKDFSPRFLEKLARQAEGKCLGQKGIIWLAKQLQNEVIHAGYITSYINIPSQDLRSGALTYQVNPGRVGDVAFTPDSQRHLILTNSLPFSTSDILNLRDLERAAENLQRIPGSAANMQIFPGASDGFSNIAITRKQEKYWQAGLWMDDAGSRYTGRYQGGAVLYAYNPTALNDIFFISAGHDLEFNQAAGSYNASIGYSIPWRYWSLDLYANTSRYHQSLSSSWGQLPFTSKYQYASAELTRVLSHTRTQRTSAGVKVFKGSSRYYLDDIEVGVMHKQTPGWKFSLQHQHYFERATVDIVAGVQDRFNLLASTKTAEEQAHLVSSHARIVSLDIQALKQFEATGPNFTWAPHLAMQYSPDELTQQNQFSVGSRWTVRGFDGENSLAQNSGWYLSNDFIRKIAATDQNAYLGLDIGRVAGGSTADNGNVISGSVIGLKGQLWQTSYNVFAGAPLYKPKNFATNSMTIGFSLQWFY